MDTIRFKLDKYEENRINIFINGQNLIRFVEKQEIQMGMAIGSYGGLNSGKLLEELFNQENPYVLACGCHHGCLEFRVTIREAEKSIIWEDFDNPGKLKKPRNREDLLLCNPPEMDASNVGVEYPSLHFEFEKKQYYKAIWKLLGLEEMSDWYLSLLMTELAIRQHLLLYRFNKKIAVLMNKQLVDKELIEEEFFRSKKYNRKKIKFFV
jgi:hypothetical protein